MDYVETHITTMYDSKKSDATWNSGVFAMGVCAGDRLQAGIRVKNNSLITHKSAVGISFWNYAAYIPDIGI